MVAGRPVANMCAIMPLTVRAETRSEVHDFEFGPFTLRVEAGELWREDQRVDLRPKCFDLLLFLLEHRGKLIRRETLFDQFWPDVVVSDATLSRTMTELREALGDDAATPRYIETVPRRGYKFIAAAGETKPPQRASRTPTFSLVYRGEQHALIPGEHIIGRSNDVSIPIFTRQISRHHARIVIDGETAVIEDLGSRNGTFVNGDAIRGTVRLQSRDEIRVGDETLVLWSLKDASTEGE
jgi:DNA-binding winged helix-turn-helix (wHTH) protein